MTMDTMHQLFGGHEYLWLAIFTNIATAVLAWQAGRGQGRRDEPCS